MNIKEKISIFYTSLTPTEKRIYTQIIDNPEIIINHSIIEAAKLCQTSKSAMLRFAKKLEYRGYSDFKYAIEEYHKDTILSQSTSSQNSNILHDISETFLVTIRSIGQLDYDQQLKELIHLMANTPYVKALGIGNSAFCANQLIYSLYSHNLFFDAVTDDVQFTYLANCLTKDYLLIVFSVSGSDNTYLSLFKKAHSINAKTILITMNNDSILNKYAHMVFLLPSHVSSFQHAKVLKQLDNRTTLYYFAEIISYYYGLYLEDKQ